jgi:hypothetical protein
MVLDDAHDILVGKYDLTPDELGLRFPRQASPPAQRLNTLIELVRSCCRHHVGNIEGRDRTPPLSRRGGGDGSNTGNENVQPPSESEKCTLITNIDYGPADVRTYISS